MTESIPLGPGREFEVIRELVRRWESAARGIGDDAAILEVPTGTRLVASTDANVENVHFRREWLTPEEIGYRAATAALSDLAAMAARPIAMLVAMVVPPSWRDELRAIADGVGEASRSFAAPISGGNLTGGSELALTLTVLGVSANPLARSGARVGDAVYVTGVLGGPRRALEAWNARTPPQPPYRSRFARPVARVEEALWLAAHGATAAIDVSDGLAADVRHLATASGVGACLELDAIPAMTGVSPMDALASGEEYELVVTAQAPFDEHAFAQRFGVPLTRVGVISDPGPAPGAVRVRSRGTFVDLPPGHDHFSP
jgi:thiamine-monophosphate kinase